MQASVPRDAPSRSRRQIKRQAQRQAALPPPRDYPEREPPPWKPLG